MIPPTPVTTPPTPPTGTDLIPTLRTDRLVLRAPHLDDLPALTAFFASAQSHTVGGPRDALGSAMSLDSVFGHWITKGFGSWFVADAKTDAFLGRVGFIFAPGWDEPELGWAVTAAAQGHGIAFEAVTAARDYGAQYLGLDAAISYIRPTNTRSIALAGRLGARFERTGSLVDLPVHIYRHPTCADHSGAQTMGDARRAADIERTG